MCAVAHTKIGKKNFKSTTVHDRSVKEPSGSERVREGNKRASVLSLGT